MFKIEDLTAITKQGNPRADQVLFDLEVVTPMFLAGADPKHSNLDHELLRIPSLRGVLRWWWRSTRATANAEDLAKEEAAVWGSTTCQGLVVRSIAQSGFKVDKGIVDGPGSPTFYLGFGAVGKVSRGAIEPGKPAIEAGRFTFAATGTNLQMDALKSSLTLLNAFGGMGSRSRRAWGSVAWIAENGSPRLFPENTEQLRKSLDAEIRNLPSRVTSGANLQRAIISKEARLAVAARIFNDPGEIRLAIFNILKGTAGLPGTHKGQWCFGLPHRAYQGPKLNRRGSSLLFKTHRLGDRKYALSALLMGGQFLPKGTQPSQAPLIDTLNAIEGL